MTVEFYYIMSRVAQNENLKHADTGFVDEVSGFHNID